MKEIWKPVVGFEDYYEISSYGRCRSVARSFTDRLGRPREFESKILKAQKCNPPYDRISLRGESRKVHTFTIHKLVSEAFIGPRPKGFQCCHLDGDPTNNHVSNLKYGTPKENEAMKINHGTKLFGEKTNSSKLTEKEVKKILKMRNEGYKLKEIAPVFKITMSNVSSICKRQSWVHLDLSEGFVRREER